MRRLALFALFALLLTGCGTTVPGGGRGVTTPTPVTVVGKIAETGPLGNATRGKAIFLAQGCGACHTFTPAGTNGKVGPNLDRLPQSAKVANQGTLPQFVKTSIVDPSAYIAPGYPNAMPPSFGQTLSDQQLADLVAFLVKGAG